tara:strand:- start:9847 stop:10206 length:360 start_codon:yes stop_codon:yes gene_type:complete
MRTLNVKVESRASIDAGFAKAMKAAKAGKAVKPSNAVCFDSYEDIHRVLAPSRLQIVKTLAGQGPLSIREVARRVDRDMKAVHTDVTTLINAGVIDRTEEGVSFPYDRIHLEVDIEAAA